MKKIALFITIILGFLFISCAGNKLNDGMYAKIITNKGEILLSLTYEKTPLTVASFICLAEGLTTEVDKPFYNGLKFHRVIDNFMIQGGCPLGNGSGDPGYSFSDELHAMSNYLLGPFYRLLLPFPNLKRKIEYYFATKWGWYMQIILTK